MPLNIKDPEVDRVVRELADVTGEPITTAVRIAAEERLRRVGPRRDGRSVHEAIEDIVQRMKALPVLDDRSPDEIIGYNEHGHFDSW